MIDKIVLGGLGALFAAGLISARRTHKETIRRRSSPIEWDPRFSQSDFEATCADVAHRLPRVSSATIDGLAVTLLVRSNSGLTTWTAEIDFNDYGALTGKHWINSENKQSPIPQAFADAIVREVDVRVGI